MRWPTGVCAVIEAGDKPRFQLSTDGRRIRARYGHSVPVDLGHDPQLPPETLYHGTVAAALEAIAADGLQPRSRQQVHLSEDVHTARQVGARRGRPIVLEVAAGRMAADGHRFTRAADGIWLVDHVPPAYLTLTERSSPGGLAG